MIIVEFRLFLLQQAIEEYESFGSVREWEQVLLHEQKEVATQPDRKRRGRRPVYPPEYQILARELYETELRVPYEAREITQSSLVERIQDALCDAFPPACEQTPQDDQILRWTGLRTS